MDDTNTTTTTNKTLHVAIFPWLAFGHLIPFLQLSVSLANSGHRVSFISTPSNLRRLQRKLPAAISFVELPLPPLAAADSTADLPTDQTHLLKTAYDLLSSPLRHFLIKSSPDWIVYDFASYWAGPLARELGINSAMLTTFPSAVMAFFGPIEMWAGEARKRTWAGPESLTKRPDWIPFDSGVAFRGLEAETFYPMFFGSGGGGTLSDFDRVKLGVEGCDVVAIRSCGEYEGEYLELLEGFYKKPVIPVGCLPPSPTDLENNEEGWRETFSWLDKQKPRSVVFVSFGSEYKFSAREVREIAHGLEISNIPFLWALRRPSWLNGEIGKALPEGFMDRINGRGIVEVGWAPQLEILAHESIGGSLFHCGLGSIVETLRHGHVPVLMPLIFDQGLNARFLVEKGVGIEVERNEDGSFNRDEIAKCLRIAMVSDEGGPLRAKAREMGAMVGDQALHDGYVKRFAEYLVCNASNKSDA